MIYLDNAATSFPKAPGVPEAVVSQLSAMAGNPGRGGHSPALAAANALFDAREETAALLGFPSPERLCFTKNATEALNLALLGSVEPGTLVATSRLEHNAVMRPLKWLEKNRGVRLLYFDGDPLGNPDPDSWKEAMRARPALMVFGLASNVTGAIMPFEDMAGDCTAAGIPFGVDASQALGHIPVSAKALGCSFLCFPGHKGLLGPSGTGGICLAEGFSPSPLIMGGTGSHSADDEVPSQLPDRYESGTQNLPGVAGLLAAVRYLAGTGIHEIQKRDTIITKRLVLGLRSIGGIMVFGHEGGRPALPVVSIAADGIGVVDLSLELDRAGIAARGGLQCAPGTHRALGTLDCGGTLRLSPSHFTTEAEIDDTLSAIERIVAAKSGGAHQ